ARAPGSAAADRCRDGAHGPAVLVRCPADGDQAGAARGHPRGPARAGRGGRQDRVGRRGDRGRPAPAGGHGRGDVVRAGWPDSPRLSWWDSLWRRFWTLPMVIASVSLLLGLGLPAVDAAIEQTPGWVFQGGVDGARSL